jgi:hypothetical protein
MTKSYDQTFMLTTSGDFGSFPLKPAFRRAHWQQCALSSVGFLLNRSHSVSLQRNQFFIRKP